MDAMDLIFWLIVALTFILAPVIERFKTRAVCFYCDARAIGTESQWNGFGPEVINVCKDCAHHGTFVTLWDGSEWRRPAPTFDEIDSEIDDYHMNGSIESRWIDANPGSDWYSDEHETLADRKFADSQNN